MANNGSTTEAVCSVPRIRRGDKGGFQASCDKCGPFMFRHSLQALLEKLRRVYGFHSFECDV
jgi:hypothetical protein